MEKLSKDQVEGDMPIRVLKAILYAHGASSSFCDQSFLEMFIVFSNMFMISLFEIFAFPFDYGR